MNIYFLKRDEHSLRVEADFCKRLSEPQRRGDFVRMNHLLGRVNRVKDGVYGL